MKPTQFELATLAATQQGSPHQQAQAALALWKACGDELAREATFQDAVTAEDDRRAQIQALFNDSETVSLDGFLRATMPQSKPEDRLRKFREWTRRSIAYHDKLEGDELENATAEAITRTRTEGYHSRTAADLARVFLGFVERDRHEKNTARARKGAAAKKSARKLEKIKKSPQAKRKTRQAKV